VEQYTPRYAKPIQSVSNRMLRWLFPVVLFALGASIGAWIWALTQSTESIEEVFQIPESISTPEPTVLPEVETTIEQVPSPTVVMTPDPYPGWVDPASAG
jgi:hypothetical protein